MPSNLFILNPRITRMVYNAVSLEPPLRPTYQKRLYFRFTSTIPDAGVGIYI